MIIINYKNYKIGKEVLDLAKTIEKSNKDIIVCIPTTNIKTLSQNTKLKIFSQHTDTPEKKTSTGYNLLKSLKVAGAKGTLINHSEHRVTLQQIQKTIHEAKKLKLKVIVCAPNIKIINKIVKLKPWAIAFEDKKLIATGKSITKHNPDEIKKFVKTLKKTKIIPICGAGISTKEDYKEALELGCKGVLIASAVANSKNPTKTLKELQS